jgi:hypothetical protein
MILPRRGRDALAAAAATAIATGCLTVAGPAAAGTPAVPPGTAYSGVQLEHLDRGLVAATTDEGVFLSWRLLGTEVTGTSDEGVEGATFNVYRDGTLLGAVTDSTNFLDEGGDGSSTYAVAAVEDGVEQNRSPEITPQSQAYLDVPLNKPADGVTPAGDTYSYVAGDMSVGDVDGDGTYEYFVKWDPTNAKDVSVVGYTGNVYIDAYKADGTQLYRIDLGVNIRAGEHYTQFMVYDFDGDGRAEVMLKTAPGTKTVTYANGRPVGEHRITLPADDVAAGYSHHDDYRVGPAEYYEHVVDMFQGWSEHPEVVAGRWPTTLEQAFGIPDRYSYPLSRADAKSLADYFMDVYAPARSSRNNLREFEGFILWGPEYLTVFEGASGAELQTIDYEPGRGDDGLMWGDYAYPRIEPGNRVDRFIAGVAYLDGRRPSAVFARGYYTRASLVAYDWDGRELSRRWAVDSGWVPMTNPFNDTPHGRDGTSAEFKTLTNQGFHSLSAADVDRDGRQEIVYGSATIDDDGSLLYSSFADLPEGSAAPGEHVRLGHGDHLHVTDIDPERPGLEIFSVHENATRAPYGFVLRDASDGGVVYGRYTGRDTGRGTIGDIDPDIRGLETWAVGLWSADGRQLSTTTPSTNFGVKWGPDMTTQTLNWSNGTQTIPVLDDAVRGRLLTAEGARANLGTRAVPGLAADVLGDWREEVLLSSADSTQLRIYFSTELTTHKLYTLMHDPQYRAEVARQNTTYNQPSYTSFYLASDMTFRDVPVPDIRVPAVPEAPTQVEARAGDGSAEVSWTPADGDAYPPVTGYTVTTAPSGPTCHTVETSCVVTGLTNGKSYSFAVVAHNQVGTSSKATSGYITPAWEPGGEQVSVLVTATPKCISGKPRVDVQVLNRESVTVDAGVTSEFAEKKLNNLKPGDRAHRSLKASGTEIEAGAVVIAAHKQTDGVDQYTEYEAAYPEIRC